MATGSKGVKYLLIGGGLAAGQAAKQLRESDPGGSITLVGEEPYVPYDRPPLTKEFLRGEKSKYQLLFDPESFFRHRAIDLVLGVAVRGLDAARKTVRLANGDTIAFEKALIATGGRPIRLNLPGADLRGVGWTWVVTRPGLPRIRTCPLRHPARQVTDLLRDARAHTARRGSGVGNVSGDD